MPKRAHDLKPGTILHDRYMVGENIGCEGFCIVYAAWDTKLDIPISIKEFFAGNLALRGQDGREVISRPKSAEEFERRKTRFLTESRMMLKFRSNRNFVNTIDDFEENNTIYVVMEALEGMTLDAYIAEHDGKISFELACSVINAVGSALRDMHSHGLIHMDVSPETIFINTEKNIHVKLMNLGTAQLAESTDDRVSLHVRAGYSPAEQYEPGQKIGPWIDIYALGATFYRLVTGIKPEEATNRKIADQVLLPCRLNQRVSENLSSAILKAMAVDKNMRWGSVDEFLEAANRANEASIQTNPRPKRRNKAWIVWTALFSLFLAAGLSLCLHVISQKKNEVKLAAATISVWFSVEEHSGEAKAMKFIQRNFQENFPDVKLELRAIPKDEYEDQLLEAAENGEMPDLFESTGISQEILGQCNDLDAILETKQFQKCLFLDQYHSFYKNTKQIPLGIEVPLAYVITDGNVDVAYDEIYFSELRDFGTEVNFSCDSRYQDIVAVNFPDTEFVDAAAFLNNEANTSPVLVSSTMMMNEVQATLTNYEKKYVYYRAPQIGCSFTYEWSICTQDQYQLDAAQRLLSWMLGNVYQTSLMITTGNDGQIPVNPLAFEKKIKSKNMEPVEEIFKNFYFERGGEEP